LAKAEEATKKQRPSRIPAAAPRVLASCFYLGFVELDAGVEREEECGSGWSGDAEGGSTGGHTAAARVEAEEKIGQLGTGSARAS
jgi:hypothetical protein